MQDQDASSLRDQLLALNNALTAYIHCDGATATPAGFIVPGPTNDFSLLATVAKPLPDTARVLHVPSVLVAHRYAVVSTSGKNNNCMFYAVAKSILGTIQRLGLPWPQLFAGGLSRSGNNHTTPPQALFRNSRQDELLDVTVQVWRGAVSTWLQSHKDELRRWFAIKGDKYADEQMKDIAAEVHALDNKGWVGDKGAMTTLRTVLEAYDPGWWQRNRFELLYYGNSSAGPGIAGSLIKVLPWNFRRTADEYCQPPRDRKWSSRASAQANLWWGLKTPTRMHAADDLSASPVAIFGNFVQGHFEAVLQTRAIDSTADSGHIVYYQEEVVVGTMPTVETMRYYTEVPRLSERSPTQQLSCESALQGARAQQLETARRFARENVGGGRHEVQDDTEDEDSPADKDTAVIRPAVPVYDFAAHLPDHFTAAKQSGGQRAPIFSNQPGEQRRQR